MIVEGLFFVYNEKDGRLHMRKFEMENKSIERITIEEAKQLILEKTAAISETEEIDILDASGRILAQDMVSEIDNPPFPRSPIDGYACRAEDVQSASQDNPVFLQVLEEVDAGQYSQVKVGKGQAVRIMTGAAIPKGCDCCIMQEHTDYGEKTAAVYQGVPAWTNFCNQGEDFKKGATMLLKDTRMSYVEAGILASMGRGRVRVYRQPRVAVLTTGDEVTTPGQPLLPGKIYNSNQTMLAVRMRELGIRPALVETVKDNPSEMAKKLKEAAKTADIIITTGGVSVGKKDIMHEALAEAGAERIFWRLSAKPGSPTLFSVLHEAGETADKDVPVMSLSGNPFGAAANFELLIRPMLAKMTRDATRNPVYVQAVMADSFPKASGMRRFIRGILKDGKVYMPKGLHSSGVLSSLKDCNCMVDIPAGTGALREGDTVKVLII